MEGANVGHRVWILPFNLIAVIDRIACAWNHCMQALVVVVEERAHKTGTGGDPLRGKHLTDGLCCGFLPVHRAEGQSVQYAILCLLADGAKMRRGIYPWHCVATGLRKEARKLLLP